ncbi:poly(3-hydroxyalkanoate) synthetase [Bradyrhizobium japonicum]|nr:hypothetical protein [Bradyrhizobium japonicum]MCW2225756.1 poly(3-hydroxyalkanoate) synthetase [Bradyrhizobium japonicum]MCW2340967.1 poly(3-hydroxyalkanoate) synthetase [Bradyrhizobium japonicum]
MVEALDLDEKEKHRLRFFMRQFVEAMSQTNFVAINPDAISSRPRGRAKA